MFQKDPVYILWGHRGHLSHLQYPTRHTAGEWQRVVCFEAFGCSEAEWICVFLLGNLNQQ